jgi:hypothetical protein
MEIPTFDRHLTNELEMMGVEFVHKTIEHILASLIVIPYVLYQIKEKLVKDEFIGEEKLMVNIHNSELNTADHSSI